MKRVFKSHSELCHIFASRSQDEGTSTNMSFNDGGLYSYGTCIMRFLEFRGKEFLLVNETSYSNSTSKHMSHARRAVHHCEQFRIGHMKRGESLRFHERTGEEIYKYALDCAAEFKQKSIKARTNKSWFLDRSAAMLQEAQRVSEFFELGKRVDENSIAELLKEREAAAIQHAKEMKCQRLAQEERDRIRQAEAEEDLRLWAEGKQTKHGGYFRDLPVKLRVEGSEGVAQDPLESREIVTSMGARIHYKDGLKTYRFAMKLRGRGWHRNGDKFKIGSYELDAINEHGIVAGCHRISWEEIDRFAKQEGWNQ